jgi:ATP-dependent helicase HrpB
MSLAASSPLPVTAVLPELMAGFEQHRNVVLQAPPGAGKSTLVPLALLDASWANGAKILMLEPRRLAARAIATRMAHLLGEAVGRTVGYRTRLETKVGAATRIEVVTEGILTRMLQQDAALEGVAIVIFDEFHERSLNADLGLALCLDVQTSLREDLRLLVMSATLATESVAKLMADAVVVSSQGRTFPVAVRYAARSTRDLRDLPQAVGQIVLEALTAEPGDALVFLPGQGEIRRTQAFLETREIGRGMRVLPLYGELDPAQQDLALQPSKIGERKIVLATNIAETSLTIEGVRIVIDSGWERRARFDPSSAMNRLEALRISRASAEQRTGRAGRLDAGVCYRLWSQAEHATLLPHTPAEILEVDLAPLALELGVWGVRELQQLRWLDTPPNAAFAQARALLQDLEALDARGFITEHGRAMSRLGLHPRLAHMVLRGADAGSAVLASEIAALLEERDFVRTEPPDADVDLRTRIDVLRHPGSVATVRVDEGGRQRVLRSVRQLATRARQPASTGAAPLDPGALLAYAYPDRVARRRDERGRFLLANGRGAYIAQPQSLSASEYLVIAALDLQEREARIRLAAPIDVQTLSAQFPERVRTQERIEWDGRQRAVLARRERWFGEILMEERRLERPDPTQVLGAMLMGLRELGVSALTWTRAATQLRERLSFAQRFEPEGGWPDVSDTGLLHALQEWLVPWLDGITRAEQLARVDIEQALRAQLAYEQQKRLDAIAPTHLSVPSGSHIPIDYSTAHPFVAVRLQEVFGLHTTPSIANGRVPLTLHLLSPAHRPVQVTQDLASFWAQGYADVKRELKGRYPRHYWPDDPLQATATARAKPRGQ